MTEPVGTVELYNSIFTLGTDLHRLSDLVEQGWGELATRTRESTDEFVEVTGGLLGTEWSGKTHVSFAEHRSNLAGDLDTIQAGMTTHRDAATQLVALAKSAESRLQDALARLAPLGAVREGDMHRITVSTEAEMDAVNSVVAEAHTIKRDFHDQIGPVTATFNSSAFLDMEMRWHNFAHHHQEAYDDGVRNLPPDPTFVVPERDGTMATSSWNGSHLVSTDTHMQEVEVTRKDTGWYVVKFKDTYHYVEPGQTHIYIMSRGETYEMSLESGFYNIAAP